MAQQTVLDPMKASVIQSLPPGFFQWLPDVAAVLKPLLIGRFDDAISMVFQLVVKSLIPGL
jgi:hypothetical protein